MSTLRSKKVRRAAVVLALLTVFLFWASRGGDERRLEQLLERSVHLRNESSGPYVPEREVTGFVSTNHVPTLVRWLTETRSRETWGERLVFRVNWPRPLAEW